MKRRSSQKRNEIKHILTEQNGALSATAIHGALPHIDPTTIYRNLELFVSEGTVKKLLLGGETVYEYQAHPHHHAVCDTCHQVLHFTAADEQIKKLLTLPGFTITNMEITVHGQCLHKLAKK